MTAYVKLTFGLDTDSKAFLVTTAFYMAYFFLTLPSSWVLEKTGMKKGTAMVLKESSYASIENFDHACRNNTGYLMTLVGVFRWMDLTGVPAYHTLMKDLLPTLNNNPAVPQLIDNIVREDGRGVANAKGFCNYTPKEAKLWEETFTEFSYEIRKLALKYPL